MNMVNMKLSVCISTYNHERFIAQAIESVLMQQTDFDFEIIIGEDDSSDTTRAIVKDYKERFPARIRLFLNDRKDVIYIHGQPTGLWNFTNKLNNARGEYIALLDGDDYWTSPNKLQQQVDLLEKEKHIAGCFHETQLIYSDGTLGKVYGRDAGNLLYAEDTIAPLSPFHTSSFVFRKDALQIPGWFYQVISADIALFSIVSAFGPLRKIPKIMSVYRKHDAGITSTPKVVEYFHSDRISLIKKLDMFHGYKYTKKADEVIRQHQNDIEKLKPHAALNPDTSILKICYILLHIPVPSETFVINEIIALQSLGVDIFPISLWPSRKCHEELMNCIKNPIYNLSYVTTQLNASKNSFYPVACRLAANYDIPQVLAVQAALAAEYVVTCAINHIHAHFATEAAWVALIVSKMTGIPFSFTAHAYDIFRLNVAGETYPDRRLKLLVENAAKTITISEFNRKHILSIMGQTFSDKLEVVHCGIDPERFGKLEKKTVDTVTFLTVGRLVSKKGHEFLLRSFKHVVETCDARLIIVGEGDLLPALTALARELDLSDRVTFIGAVSSERVLHEMQHADVFVLHSLTGSDGDKEGIPVSIMEASATALPVVSTRHSGIPELIIEGVSGFLVEERDCDGFAEAMRSLAVSPQLRATMGMAGHTVVTEKFNLHVEAQKLKNIFTSIIEESSANSTKNHQALYRDGIIPNYRLVFRLLNQSTRSVIGRLLRKIKRNL